MQRKVAPRLIPLTSEQKHALENYAREHGPGWKRKLAAEWVRASAPPELHALRNSHGSGWLHTFEMHWSARCDCYAGHNSASGRCNARDVYDAETKRKIAVCQQCRKHCLR